MALLEAEPHSLKGKAQSAQDRRRPAAGGHAADRPPAVSREVLEELPAALFSALNKRGMRHTRARVILHLTWNILSLCWYVCSFSALYCSVLHILNTSVRSSLSFDVMVCVCILKLYNKVIGLRPSYVKHISPILSLL